jgi:hypothetical protein
MGLLKKLLGGESGGAKPGAVASLQFQESETGAQQANSVNAPRRELVQVVLRDTMRKLAIPSDWIDCRILSVVTRKHKTGMHVQFIVRKGEDQLLPYVRAFQDAFWTGLEKFEARPREWLFSLAWQFEGERRVSPPMPAGWDVDTRPPGDGRDGRDGHDTLPPDDADELATDLQALYAIRDAELSRPAGLAEPPAEKPRQS